MTVSQTVKMWSGAVLKNNSRSSVLCLYKECFLSAEVSVIWYYYIQLESRTLQLDCALAGVYTILDFTESRTLQLDCALAGVYTILDFTARLYIAWCMRNLYTALAKQ